MEELLFSLTVFFGMAYIIYKAHFKIKELGGPGAPFVGEFIDQIFPNQKRISKKTTPIRTKDDETVTPPLETAIRASTVVVTAKPITEKTIQGHTSARSETVPNNEDEKGLVALSNSKEMSVEPIPKNLPASIICLPGSDTEPKIQAEIDVNNSRKDHKFRSKSHERRHHKCHRNGSGVAMA